jgi:hypothetical protein
VMRNGGRARVRRAVRHGHKVVLEPGAEEMHAAQFSGRATGVVRRLRAPAEAVASE